MECPEDGRILIVDLSGYLLDALREDGEFILYRARAKHAETPSVLVLSPVSGRPTVETLKKIDHEYALKDELDPTWAVRPCALSHCNERAALVLEDPGGVPLHRLIQGPMELKRFLHLAIGLASALSQLHERGLMHKDLKPSNVLVDSTAGQAWLTGFGIASRLRRERQSPAPPEFIAGTLPYMAPEQTGRMNRSIDSRSDLYSLGVTLYEMLVGSLPFTASDPMEWVHSHIARQPLAPGERLNNVPASVSTIVMKLLAKTAEERYQTAIGAESDLRRCLAEWETRGRIDEFPLGENDTPDRLLIPERLYGRGCEIDTLLTCFDRVVSSGKPELVLVSGYSGIGKSSVVNELHKPLVPPRGLFASGKFDQYKRDIPYATVAQAFQNLIRTLLSKGEPELGKWRDAIREAVGPNGRLIVDLVPELKLIIGEQPPVSELPPQDSQGRFQLVFRRFISVFARPEHPLALFLDDLQWLDAATLDLLQDLLTQPDVKHLMLIGAYRDNEVNTNHPLIRKLMAIRHAGGAVQEIVLAPLAREDLTQLMVDTLHCEPQRVFPLVQLVHEKTGGNPFFAIQFAYALVEEALLTFDHRCGQWSWDLNRIHAKGYTDNVVDLMAGKLNRLPIETQNALKQLACLGNSADFAVLGTLYEKSDEEMHRQLWEAVRAGLIFRSEDSYRFIHDRVQEAAYSLIPEESRTEVHLRIGRLLEAQIPLEKQGATIFEIVNQLNRGAALITSGEEREHLAELNLIAGKRARTSTAYTSALKYFAAGTALLLDEPWKRRHELIFSLELHRAECEFLTGQSEAAQEHLIMLSSNVATTIELAKVACLRIDLYTALYQSDRAVAVFLGYLEHLGIKWSPRPTGGEARREYDQIWAQLGSRSIAELIELPSMTDPVSLATLDVFTKGVMPAIFTDPNLGSLAISRAVRLTLEHGVSDGSCFTFVYLGMIAGPYFGDYDAGFRFGQLGYELVERRGLRRFQASTYMLFAGHVIPWTKHVKASGELLDRAFEAANRIGDLPFAAACRNNIVTNRLAVGDPLEDVQVDGENALEFARGARVGFVTDILTGQLGLIRTLRGSTTEFGYFNEGQFDELEFERHLEQDPAALPKCFYWIRKLQAQFLAGNYASALDASLNAKPLLWAIPSNFEIVEYHFYSALSRAASWDSAPPDQRQQYFEDVVAHHRQLEVWAENCPENFESRAALVGAEMARAEGRDLEAMRLYDRAIRSARENGFVHVEGVANEVAGRFYMARGFDKIADAYLREARYGYLRWGADGKVKQLDQLYPRLREEQPVAGPTSTIGTLVEHLDLATVIKVSQAVSSEIVLEKLVDTLLHTAVEHAGAERGLLIWPRGTDLRVEAEATTVGSLTSINFNSRPVSSAEAPAQVVQFAARTHEAVILDDASHRGSFSEDEYIRRRRSRSILCLPLVKQRKLVALLYLENSLAANVFTPRRVAVLNVLASAAAISLENSRLYQDLQEREAKIRRLVDANIVGIFTWDFKGRILEANDAFLRIVGYNREDLASGSMQWRSLTPSEWHDRDDRALADLTAVGSTQPYEKELSRKDGTRVPVLVGGALFDGVPNEAVSFVLELTEQKRAGDALRRSERELRQVIETIPAMVWTALNDGSNALMNRRWTEYTGSSAAGLGWQGAVHADDLKRHMEVFKTASTERSLFEDEVRFRGADGEYRWFLVQGMPLVDDEANILKWYGIVTDIEDRKRAEEVLREQASLLSLTHDAILVCDLNGILKYWNRGAEELYGWTAEEAIGKLTHGLLKTVFSTSLEEITAEVMSKGRWEGELVQTKKDGMQIVTASRWSLQRDEGGSPVGVLETNNDITKGKRAEEALKRSESYLAQAQRLSHTGSWQWNVRSGEVSWSREYCGIFGFDCENDKPSYPLFIGRVHPEDRPKVEQVLWADVREKRDFDGEYRLLLPDGSIKYVHSLGKCSVGRTGEVEYIGAVIDITERKRAEEERERLRQAQAELGYINRVSTLGELTASLAHEIKQPIGSAVTNAEACVRLIDRDQPDVPEAREAALEMVKDARRAADIIDRVRSLYQKGSSELDAVDVNEIIREMVVMLQNEANRHSVAINTDLAAGLPRVMADRVQLQQALMNLMLNGFEAMQETGGELSVKSQLGGDGQLLISVADMGVGLPADNANKIFDAFFTTKSQGTGLGLAITRSIVKSHGGQIWATANSGRGATFHFTLPRTVAVAA
jgi:PAS domain S-box-containing protein